MKKSFLLTILLALLINSNPISAHIVDPNSEEANHTARIVFDTIPVDLEELAVSADRIFSGICLGKIDVKNKVHSNLQGVKYTFKIVENIKGLSGKREISFTQWKPTTTGAGYDIGEKYVLFLHPDSKIGFTTPVGFLQGQFKIKRDESSKNEFVLNKVSNIGLHKNLQTKKKITLKNRELLNRLENNSEKGNPIKYSEFIETVKEVVKQQNEI